MNIKKINQFLSSMHMGSATIRVLYHKVKTFECKQIFEQVLNDFLELETAMNAVFLGLGIEPVKRLSFREQMVKQMIKLKSFSCDFFVMMEAFKAMQMGIEAGLIYIHKHQKEMPDVFLEQTKVTIAHYKEDYQLFYQYIYQSLLG